MNSLGRCPLNMLGRSPQVLPTLQTAPHPAASPLQVPMTEYNPTIATVKYALPSSRRRLGDRVHGEGAPPRGKGSATTNPARGHRTEVAPQRGPHEINGRQCLTVPQTRNASPQGKATPAEKGPAGQAPRKAIGCRRRCGPPKHKGAAVRLDHNQVKVYRQTGKEVPPQTRALDRLRCHREGALNTKEGDTVRPGPSQAKESR